MSPEWVSILALVALFVVGTVLPINMGALAFVAAWLVGMYSLGLDEKEIISGISGDLILTLVGVTYLFAIARNNGTVDLIVRKAVQAVGGRVALIPWVMFFVTALLTAIGAASPAACAIIGPIALGFAGRYKINPLLMGMLVVHGAQAGGFSPISIYGTITNSVMRQNDLPVGEVAVFLTSLVVNLAIAAALFLVLGGRELTSRRIGADEPNEPEAGVPAGGAGGGTTTATGPRWAPATSPTTAARSAPSSGRPRPPRSSSTRWSPWSRSSRSPSWRWSSTRTSASPPSPPRSSSPRCSPSSRRAPSRRSPGPPSCWSPGSAPSPRSWRRPAPRSTSAPGPPVSARPSSAR